MSNVGGPGQLISPSTQQSKTGTSPETPQAPAMSQTSGKLLSPPGQIFPSGKWDGVCAVICNSSSWLF